MILLFILILLLIGAFLLGFYFSPGEFNVESWLSNQEEFLGIVQKPIPAEESLGRSSEDDEEFLERIQGQRSQDLCDEDKERLKKLFKQGK